MAFFHQLQFGFLRSTRARLLLLVLILVIPALGVQLFGAWVELRQNIDEQESESLHLLNHAQNDFSILMNDTQAAFTELVRVNDMRSSNNCTQMFTALRFAYERLAPNVTNIGLADAGGNIYCAINPVQGSANIADHIDFQSSLKTLDIALGVYTPSQTSGSPYIEIAYPVLSFNGDVQTVIFATLGTEWLENWVSEIALPENSSISLFTPSGEVLHRRLNSQPVSTTNLNFNQLSWYSREKINTTTAKETDFDGESRLHAIIPLSFNGQNGAFLHLGYPLEGLYKKVYSRLGWQLGFMAILAILVLGIAWWVSERLFLQPLNNLVGVVKRVQKGDLNARVSNLKGLGELSVLAHSFDQMADALQQREADRKLLEERFRAAFESSAIGMGLLSLDGRILAANQAVCQMSGYSEEELLQRFDHQNVFPEDKDKGTEFVKEMLEGKRRYFNVEKRYVRKNGEIFWTRLTLSIMHDTSGNPEYFVALIEDIDEEKRKSAALSESESRFKAMFETSAVGIGILGLDRKLMDANPAMCKMLGYTHEELVGLSPATLTYPDDSARSTNYFEELVSGKRPDFFDERRYIRKNGEVFWARITMSIVRAADGKPLYIVGMILDINEERIALSKLQESEARFKSMYENAPIGISLIAPNRQILGVNPALVRMAGRSEAELIAIGSQGIVYPDDENIGRDEFIEIMQGKRESFQVEKRYVHKDGRVQWMRQGISAVRDADGNLIYVLAIAEDIDQQKRAVEELRESEERFRAMFDSAAVGVAVMSLDRRIVQVNQTAERLTGYSGEELASINPSLLALEEDRFIDQPLFEELIAGTRDQYTVEKRYIRKGGIIFWGRVNFSVVRSAQGKPLYTIGIIEDISEEKSSDEKLNAQETRHRQLLEKRIAERTEELNRANLLLREKAAQDAVIAERTRLARDLHDAVTQTLFSTTLIADVLPEIWEMNADEGKRRLEELRLLTRGALAEMRNLLVELRPNALVEVPLPTLLRQLTEALIGRSRINIQLSAEGDRKLPADVQVGLYRIAQEALNNVVKHANASEAVLTLRLGNTVRLTVADNGKGFDPSTVTGDHLGLKIMRERAEAIDARFTIYSEPDEGTQITVLWQEKWETQ